MNTLYNEARADEESSQGSVEIPRWKRVLDITLIILALPVLLPLMIILALVIRFASAGPVLFKQERIGHLGKRFMCFKFRTMAVNNDTSIHQGHLNNLIGSDKPMIKMDLKGDPRIIPFGVPIRSSGLDELPQIINVLRGEMSLVGPRPCVLYEYEKYLPRQKERFNTLPGLTGLWQVSGKNRTTFEEMIQLDIDYGKRKSLWLDCLIIAKTIPALVVQMQDTRKRKKQVARLTPTPAVIEAETYAAPRNFHRVLQTETRR
ncbi:MAG: Undecaprenyl-phosphate galactose phosphotransferase [Pedosphaera sp.]|nr:Undecaprenyl-phosphate galactose phosphotransferase [Pedosphaera sp.]